MGDGLVIIGAGGFGREVLDIVRALEGGSGAAPHFLGFIDDGTPDRESLERIRAPHLGGVEVMTSLPGGTEFVIGVGSGEVRRNLEKKAVDAGLRPGTLVDPRASLGADVEVGPGSVICAGVRITTNVRIGRHVHINLNSTVGHDVIVNDYVTINPLVAISGDVTIGENSMIGTTSCVNQGLTIGADAVVASGSAVTRDVPDRAMVAGVPALVKKVRARDV